MPLLRFPLLSALIALLLGGFDQAASDTTDSLHPATADAPAAHAATAGDAAKPDAAPLSPPDECPSDSASCP